MDTFSSVLSKLDQQKIGEILFNKASDILNFVSTPADARGQAIIFNLKNVLEQNKSEISKLLTHEIGKPVTQCEIEIDKSVEILINSEKTEPPSQNEKPLLVLGSLSNPVLELANAVAFNVEFYSKIIYKPSTKAAITLNYIYEKMCEELGIRDKILIAPMTKSVLDEVYEKVSFAKVIKYSRGKVTKKNLKVEDLSEKDKILLLDVASDLDLAAGLIADNISSFSKFNTSRLQHVFLHKDIIDAFHEKLVSKLDLVVNPGKADNPEVNFADTFKAYKRKNVKELMLELVSLGADIIYGSVEDIMSAPVIIKCTEIMEEYYKKDFWAPVVFIIEYEHNVDIPMLIVPFVQTHRALSLLTIENFQKIAKSSAMEIEDLQNKV